jgi:protein-disulfide isomerase
MRQLAVAGIFLAACAAAPRAEDPSVATRLAAIEAELAAQRLLLEKVAAGRDTVEIGAIAGELASLREAIKGLEPRKRVVPSARPEPDRATVYAVPIDGSATFGRADAKVTLVMAMDFACPYCNKAYGTVDELRKRYGGELRVVYQSYVVHAVAAGAARLACAANLQGTWRPVADALWAKAFPERRFDDASLDAAIAGIRLDRARLKADVDGPCVAIVAREHDRLERLGVSATPTFYVNGRFLSGARPIEQFAALIDEELAKARAAIASGVRPEAYYPSLVEHGQADGPVRATP